MLQLPFMKSNWWKSLALAGLGTSLASLGSGQIVPSGSVEKPVAAVTVPFFVDDGHGNLMTEIALTDISILDDKKAPQQVVALHTPKESPLRLGLLIDNSGSQKYTYLYVPGAKAAFDFLRDIFGGLDDKVFVLGFANETRGTGFLNKDDFVKLQFKLEPGGHTALYEAVYFACTERMKHDPTQPSRRALVLLTDGDDTKSHVSLAKAIAAAQSSGTVVFIIGTGARYARSPLESVDVDPVLEQLASETGGLSFSGLAPKDLPKVFATIKTRIDHLASVAYVPAEARATRHFHSLELKIASDKKWKVHAPKGYVQAGQ